MPLYEYLCSDCGKRFDALRSMREADSPIACKYCAGQKTSRQLSVFYAQSGGRSVAGTGGGSCSGCSGGTCSSCGH